MSNIEQLQTSARDGQQTQLQPIPATFQQFKVKRSRKAPALKTAVVLKRSQGQDKTSISRELGIARNTVTAILEESDAERQLSAAHQMSCTLLPKAIQAVEKTLDKGDGILGLNFLKWQLGENPNSKNGQQKGLEAVFSNCQVLIQQATASTLHKNAAEPSTNNQPAIPQVTDTTQDKP